MAVTKSDLIQAVATTLGGDKKNARNSVHAVLNAMVNALTNGEDIRVQGFGTLKVTQCGARLGRNPNTGEAVPIPAFNTVRFKAADALKAALPPVKAD